MAYIYKTILRYCPKNSASGYMKYIATRERVELIKDDRHPTSRQEALVVKL